MQKWKTRDHRSRDARADEQFFALQACFQDRTVSRHSLRASNVTRLATYVGTLANSPRSHRNKIMHYIYVVKSPACNAVCTSVLVDPTPKEFPTLWLTSTNVAASIATSGSTVTHCKEQYFLDKRRNRPVTRTKWRARHT